jgi:hypothetical protein
MRTKKYLYFHEILNDGSSKIAQAPDVPTVLHDFCPDCSGRVEVRTNAVRM